MALKPDRQINLVDLRFYLNETASQGQIVSLSTVGSGADMDSSSNQGTIAATPSGGVPLGLLLTDVVNIDTTRYPVNWHKDETQQGGKVCLLRDGWVVTNQITGTPNAGDVAVVGPSGTVQAGSSNDIAQLDSVTEPVVGRFDSEVDADGYVMLRIHL